MNFLLIGQKDTCKHRVGNSRSPMKYTLPQLRGSCTLTEIVSFA